METKIKVDSREPEKLFNILKKQKIEYEKTTLPIGDFVYGNIVIERKTVEDLVNSIRTGHLQKQLLQMQHNYEHCFLIISGDVGNFMMQNAIKGRIPWTVNQHIGTLASLATRYEKLKVIQVTNDTQLVKIIPCLISKCTDGKIVDVSKTELMRDKYRTKYATKIRMLMTIPGMGYTRAIELLKCIDIKLVNKNGNPINTDDLKKINGVGDKTIKYIMELNDGLHSA